MKFKNLSLAFATLLAAAGIAGLSFTIAPETYKVDAAASKVEWKAYKVTGQHFGTVNLKSGSLAFTNGALSGGSFEMDMTSIKVTDIEGEWAGKLEGHLKSEDFFSVEKHPTASFVITKVASRGTPGAYRVTGNLTIKGISKEIKFDATVTTEGNKANAQTAFKVDRTNYDIQYRSGNFFENLGDKTIYDEFDMNVTLVAGK